MLLTIDIGNSNIVLGVFDGDLPAGRQGFLTYQKRIITDKSGSGEFYKNKLNEALGGKIKQIKGVIIGSVVPELDEVFKQVSKTLFNKEPLFAATTLNTGLINVSTNCELGADRLANMVAAQTIYPGNAIIVDLGTATTYEVVSEKREYLGGAIGPGIGSSLDALTSSASGLSKIKLQNPEKVVILGTSPQLYSGFVFGHAEMVSGMINRMKRELGWEKCHVIGTGGFIDMISPHVPEFTKINKQLTLEGLRLLWEKNR